MFKYLFKINVVCSTSAVSYKIGIITKSNADKTVKKPNFKLIRISK